MANEAFDLDTRWIGALPVVNRFLDRLKLESFFERFVPSDPRAKVPHARVLGVVVRNLVLARVPLYRLGEWAQGFVPGLLGLEEDEARLLNDDRVGRALERLHDADRNVFVTEWVLGAIKEFEVDVTQFQNDSTSLTLHGDYDQATGQLVRGKPAPKITYGHSKDHRPDLKQLVWILTVSADGAVPVHFKVADGGTEDSTTHKETWEALRALVGSANFLYVADCKLCTRSNLRSIDEQGGRFVTVLPRTRKEHTQFRDWLQVNQAPWAQLVRRPHPRLKAGPEEVIVVCASPIPDSDGFRLIWYRSSHKLNRDARARSASIESAWKKLQELQGRLEGPRPRFRSTAAVFEEAEKALKKSGASRWVKIEVEPYDDVSYRQEKRGRPGKDTRYRKSSKTRFRLTWKLRQEAIDYDKRCDGLFPLLTNDGALTDLDVFEAYRSKQPMLEKRHDLLKNVLDATPMYLKNITRIEALLFLFFVALLTSALIEREVRRQMEQEGLESLPLYPEERSCRAPTTDRVLEVFSKVQRHVLVSNGVAVQRFEPELNKLQRKLLRLLSVPKRAFDGL